MHHWNALKEALGSIDPGEGYIIEGFPRNIEQTLLMELNNVKYDLMIDIFQPEELIIVKSKLRLVCNKCFTSYNDQEIFIGKYNLPKIAPIVNGICNSCGNTLTSRADDNTINVKKRYFDYQVNQELLKSYFTAKGKYLFFDLVNGVNDFTNLTDEIDRFFEKITNLRRIDNDNIQDYQ